jgi:glycosyltransferase involved in cell wall biosynthesis
MCALRDSFGSQILEAMCFSLPVITLNQHGAAIWVPDNCGIKIDPGAAEETAQNIATAIIKMQQDSDFRKQCGYNAYHYSKSHTWENRVSQVTDLYY